MIKLTCVILLLALMQVSAATFGQNLTLKKDNVSISRVFWEIRKQTGYDVLLKSDKLNMSRRINVAFNNAPLSKALDELIKGTDLAYTFKDKVIWITLKEKSSWDRVVERFQNIDVKGKIVDESGQPIAGATIKVKGTSILTNSGNDGAFSLKNVDETGILEITYIGFQTREVKVRKELGNVILQVSVGELEEVSVNAGYYKVKERELTGSISRVSSKDIENQPVTSVLATMQGRMPGVNIVQHTGMPGGGFNIEIRGQNSLRINGSMPLYVIDGVPYSTQDIGSTYTSGNMPQNNSPLNSINPGDIESIEVLKDADATAIYGSRGANGVVLITTRKGNVGKTSFNTNYASGFGRVTRFKEVMETPEYLAMRREAFANDGVTQLPASAYDVNGTWDQNRNTNWQKELIGGTATYNNLQSSLSGGSAQTQFLLSGNYSRETTVFPGNFEYVKGGGHLNINHNSENKRFLINFSAGYNIQFNNLPPSDLTRTATLLAPNAPPLYNELGQLNWANGTFANPVATLEGAIEGNIRDLLSSSSLSYVIGSGLTLKSSFGYTALDQKQLNLQPSTTFNPFFGLGPESSTVYTNRVNRNSWIAEPQLNWMGTKGKLTLNALLGTSLQQQKENRFVNNATGFANNSQLRNPASAVTNRVMSSEESLYKYEAYFTRINLNWAGKYLLNLTGRRDGSSRFGPGKKFGNFGAVGMAWLFAGENWIKDEIPFLSFGKLRASYGTSGNDQIGDYQYLDAYSATGTTYQGISGMQPSRLFNPDFGWEVNKKAEIALETGFLKDRIFTTLAWFQNRSSNQLVGVPLPGTTGFSSIQANLDAVVQNSGLEFSIRSENIKHHNFSWTTNFNWTSTRNKLVSFPGLEVSTYRNQYVIGQPLNIFKAYHYTGINPTTGIYQFEDINGDGLINSPSDRQFAKNLNPKFFGGVTNEIRYGNLNLDFLVQFVKQDNFNENYSNPMPGTASNQTNHALSHWQKAGDVGPYQGYSNSNGARNLANTQFSQSDAAVGDASYIRLKNISLTYQLPKDWTRNFMCKISLQGQNVLTITKYGGVDPEFRASGYLPPLRVYTGSIQLTF